MSGIVVIVMAALLGWFVFSVALALLIGRRLHQHGPAIAPSWIRPVSAPDARQRKRRSAA